LNFFFGFLGWVIKSVVLPCGVNLFLQGHYPVSQLVGSYADSC
jgi:hypothetical protein